MRAAETKRFAAILVAAGRGERAGQNAEGPKQYRRIAGEAVIARTLRAFLACEDIGMVMIAIHPDDEELFAAATAGMPRDRFRTVSGGASRQASVHAAIEALAEFEPDFVLIHDGVRPFVDRHLIGSILAALEDGSGILPAMAVSDTLKRADQRGWIAHTESRDNLFSAQTPQAFPFDLIRRAHARAALEMPHRFTDDSMLAEWAGIPVRIVEGSPENVKLTWAKDIEMAELRLASGQSGFPDVRTGTGYDVHALAAGDRVTLCGIEIPHDRRLTGHSDADVGLHALTDALLATCGEGDIGTHFPPSDPQWRGAASRIFLARAAELVRQRQGRIANIDVTLIAERPKVEPHRAAMVACLAGILALQQERVSVKATTNERLGFIGREEGIAAIATATVIYPGGVPE